MRLAIEAVKYDDGRLDKLIVKRPKKRKLTLQFIYSSDKILRGLEFDGSVDDLPDLPQIVELVSQRFIDRLQAVVDTVDIDLVAQSVGNVGIDIKAQTVGNLDIRLAVADATVPTRKSLLADPDFETGAGWILKHGAEITDAKFFTGWHCLYLKESATLAASADQSGIPPIDTNKLSGFKITQDVDDINQYARVWLYYSDGDIDMTNLIPSGVPWEAFDIAYSPDKFIVEVFIWRQVGDKGIWIDGCYPILAMDEYVGTAAGVNLNVDITAQTIGNLNVNIAAQAANINMDIKAQSVAIKGLTDWAAENATDIDVFGNAVLNDNTLTIVLSYTVPTGKTLFIYDWGVGLDEDGQILGELQDGTVPTWLAVGGGTRGFQASFNKPKRVSADHVVRIWAEQDTGAGHVGYAHMGGVLL